MSEFSIFKQPHEVMLEISSREKKLRKKQKITQAELAKKTGVSLGSLKRFEQTGEISLSALLKIARFLDVLNDFDLIFASNEETPQGIEKLFE